MYIKGTQPYECILNSTQFLPHMLKQNRDNRIKKGGESLTPHPGYYLFGMTYPPLLNLFLYIFFIYLMWIC